MKQFAIRHEASAMKVGTDGVLLGALGGIEAQARSARRVLDIGTGTGVIALMVAQATNHLGSIVIGVEKESMAASEARGNVASSPFAQSVSIIEADILDFIPTEPFDLILSNPPYYTPTHSAPDARRNVARHITNLTPKLLFSKAGQLLTPSGEIMVIVPSNASESFLTAAKEVGLGLARRISITTKVGKQSKREVLLFSKRLPEKREEQSLSILDESGDYSSAYRDLLSPFLTIF